LSQSIHPKNIYSILHQISCTLTLPLHSNSSSMPLYLLWRICCTILPWHPMNFNEWIKIFWLVFNTIITSYGFHFLPNLPLRHNNKNVEGDKYITLLLHESNWYLYIEIFYKSDKVIRTTNRGHTHIPTYVWMHEVLSLLIYERLNKT
jgi:hypothetical protein